MLQSPYKMKGGGGCLLKSFSFNASFFQHMTAADGLDAN